MLTDTAHEPQLGDYHTPYAFPAAAAKERDPRGSTARLCDLVRLACKLTRSHLL